MTPRSESCLQEHQEVRCHKSMCLRDVNWKERLGNMVGFKYGTRDVPFLWPCCLRQQIKQVGFKE